MEPEGLPIDQRSVLVCCFKSIFQTFTNILCYLLLWQSSEDNSRWTHTFTQNISFYQTAMKTAANAAHSRQEENLNSKEKLFISGCFFLDNGIEGTQGSNVSDMKRGDDKEFTVLIGDVEYQHLGQIWILSRPLRLPPIPTLSSPSGEVCQNSVFEFDRH